MAAITNTQCCDIYIYIYIFCIDYKLFWNFFFFLLSFFLAALCIKPKDVMLGTVNVPLADLIHKRTGTFYFFTVALACLE